MARKASRAASDSELEPSSLVNTSLRPGLSWFSLGFGALDTMEIAFSTAWPTAKTFVEPVAAIESHA